MPETDEDRFLSRREADTLVEARLTAHRREHEQSAEAIGLALEAAQDKQDLHNVAHDAAHEAHEEKHNAEAEAVKTALAAVARERTIHADAHERDHVAHQREHSLANLAIDKAETANDKRFAGTNAYREQINDMVRNLASRESVDTLNKEIDRRFEEQRKDTERRHEEMRNAIAMLERTDVKAEGKGLGQSAVIAYIVAGVSILGSLVVLSNLMTGTP